MKKTAVLSIVLTLLIVLPALARTHHHRQVNPTAYGGAKRAYVAPLYSNEVPWAPF